MEPESDDWIERELRREWWMNHGHPFGPQYGDDGEMQCAGYGHVIDFKREPIDSLRTLVRDVRIVSLAAPTGSTEEEE